MTIQSRLARVEERIRQAAERAGRPADLVRLVAVGKTFPPEILREAIDAGQRRLGENRVQEARTKAETLPGEVEWHLIGHLQTNKVRAAAELFDWIHSIDSERLARRLSRVLEELDRSVDVLVQVDLAGEESKHGIPEAQLFEVLEAMGDLPRLRVRGLMIIPPPVSVPEESRRWFRGLRALADGARDRSLLPAGYDLSMGMTGDFEIAVEEGATLVRVGSAIFGPRVPVSE